MKRDQTFSLLLFYKQSLANLNFSLFEHNSNIFDIVAGWVFPQFFYNLNLTGWKIAKSLKEQTKSSRKWPGSTFIYLSISCHWVKWLSGLQKCNFKAIKRFSHFRNVWKDRKMGVLLSDDRTVWFLPASVILRRVKNSPQSDPFVFWLLFKKNESSFFRFLKYKITFEPFRFASLLSAF